MSGGPAVPVVAVVLVAILVMLAVIAVPTIVAAVASRRKVAEHRRFLARAVRTPATVIQAPPGPTPPQGAPVLRPIAIYRGPDGSTLQLRLPTAGAAYPTQGQAVELLVDPTRPSTAIPAAAAGEPVRTAGTILIGVGISAVVAIRWCCSASWWWGWSCP